MQSYNFVKNRKVWTKIYSLFAVWKREIKSFHQINPEINPQDLIKSEDLKFKILNMTKYENLLNPNLKFGKNNNYQTSIQTLLARNLDLVSDKS